MTAYYNEHDPFAAAWLRGLISAGLIAPGDVDEKDIQSVRSEDLEKYTQVHLFAGIGGWSYALRLAGWPDDRPVWTGSCPCQPFSSAGKGGGSKDDRHLWPEMLRLIRERRPHVCFGEQVTNAIGHGWLDGISADLERESYAVGAAVLGAHSVGAPHIRQRLWWVADARSDAAESRRLANESDESVGATAAGAYAEPRRCGMLGGLEHAPRDGRLERRAESGRGGVGCGCRDCGVGDAHESRSQGRGFDAREYADQWTPWTTSQLVQCADGKSRRVEPGAAPLAHGVPGRVGLLRGYGNAIVPQVAASFIQAWGDVTP